jgi:hypothetical protein
MTPAVFTVEQRDRVRDRILEIARGDKRVVGGAVVGSLAFGGDRWSDLDLSFGLADGTTAAEVLADWTPTLEREFGAVPLFDLPHFSTIYRVFLLPASLQVDLSFTPASDFGARAPRFRLLFGEAAELPHAVPPTAEYLFGVAAHHALRARFSLARGRAWQAEYWISELRNHALSLACRRLGLPHAQGRGVDELPAESKARAAAAFARSLERGELLRALGAAIEALLAESGEAGALARRVEAELRALVAPGWPDG